MLRGQAKCRCFAEIAELAQKFLIRQENLDHDSDKKILYHALFIGLS